MASFYYCSAHLALHPLLALFSLASTMLVSLLENPLLDLSILPFVIAIELMARGLHIDRVYPQIYSSQFREAFNDIKMGGNQGCGQFWFLTFPFLLRDR